MSKISKMMMMEKRNGKKGKKRHGKKKAREITAATEVAAVPWDEVEEKIGECFLSTPFPAPPAVTSTAVTTLQFEEALVCEEMLSDRLDELERLRRRCPMGMLMEQRFALRIPLAAARKRGGARCGTAGRPCTPEI